MCLDVPAVEAAMDQLEESSGSAPASAQAGVAVAAF
jgi:hypothetical protein